MDFMAECTIIYVRGDPRRRRTPHESAWPLDRGRTRMGRRVSAGQFSTDTAAEIYVNDQAQTFLEDINPGNQVKGTLVFDVPKSTKLASIVLHESLFTAGVKVPLR
jgi:hypothetical protein